MALLVADCPRCASKKMTFDVTAEVLRGQEYRWKNWYEIFCVCRSCKCPTIFLVGFRDIPPQGLFEAPNALANYKAALNDFFEIDRFISLRDHNPHQPPEHLPLDIADTFNEAAACLSIGCNNAAATMFRLCIDLATRPFLPDGYEDTRPRPNEKTRRDLGLRLAWLFENGMLPSGLRDLAKCIREDANDGAHVGNLKKEDAEDLLDFTTELLERLITEPKRIELAEERRKERRQPQPK